MDLKSFIAARVEERDRFELAEADSLDAKAGVLFAAIAFYAQLLASFWTGGGMDLPAKLEQAPAVLFLALAACCTIVSLWPRDYQVDARITKSYLEWIEWLNEFTDFPEQTVEDDHIRRAIERTETNRLTNGEKSKWLSRGFRLAISGICFSGAGALIRALATSPF